MTQEQLAEKANMDVSMLARIERGSRGDIRISTLERIVKGLDVSLQEFFTFGDDQDEVMTLAASVTLIKDPEMIRALQKIVDAALGKTMKRWLIGLSGSIVYNNLLSTVSVEVFRKKSIIWIYAHYWLNCAKQIVAVNRRQAIWAICPASNASKISCSPSPWPVWVKQTRNILTSP